MVSYKNQSSIEGFFTMSKHAFHGSDLEEIEKVFGIKKENIASFAANVNPLGSSKKFLDHVDKHLTALHAYPDRDYQVLRSGISRYARVPTDYILVGSGATELISGVINSVNPGTVLMIEPTYSEYARKLSQKNIKVSSYSLDQKQDFRVDMEDFLSLLKEGYDLVMICNPNNPTGTALTAEELAQICHATKGTVLVDETYVEFCENMDLISAAGIAKYHPNLCVLRGTSKFFSTPGLRLGYLICSGQALRDKIREGIDPWSVNSIAAVSGACMFEDGEFIKDTKDFVLQERRRLMEELKALPVHLYPTLSNFILIRIEKEGIKSSDVFEHCIKQGLMIRDCESFKGLSNNHIRVCLNTKENNDRLIAALKEILRGE